METNQEQIPMTKEDIMAQLRDAIEVQELQTKLQLLRTQLVMSRYDEVKYSIAFNEMTAKPEEKSESQSDNKEA